MAVNGKKFSRVVDSVMMDLVQNTVTLEGGIVSAMSEIDFFFSSTCIFNIFIWLHMKILLNFPVGGYIGHSDAESVFPGSEGSQGEKVVNVKLQ